MINTENKKQYDIFTIIDEITKRKYIKKSLIKKIDHLVEKNIMNFQIIFHI